MIMAAVGGSELLPNSRLVGVLRNTMTTLLYRNHQRPRRSRKMVSEGEFFKSICRNFHESERRREFLKK